jgi:hypothetical protein
MGKRGYALFLILIVLWLSWRAIHYLVSSLILPSRPPSEIVNVPTKLKEANLQRSQDSPPSESIKIHQRTPLSHYHQLDEGFQFDRLNGCTASLCHDPLPHGKNKADRAFLNMHATSIHCSVCHVDTDRKPLPLVWYDLKSGAARAQGPSLLQAYAWLTSPAVRAATNFTVKDQAEIVRLMRSASLEAYGEKELTSLAEHLSAVRAASEEFVRLVKVTRETVQGHFRGEYGAKLALRDPRTMKPYLRNAGNEKAVQDYLVHRSSMTDDQKQALLKKVHPQRRAPTLHCTQCHRAEGSMIDFVALGYPPARIQAISSPQVTSAIDHIVEGSTFYLPDFLGNQQ